MIDPRKAVLIGDANQERACLLKNVINMEFLTDVVCVETFDFIKRKVFDAKIDKTRWKLVLMAADLPFSRFNNEEIMPENFSFIHQMESVVRLGCIYSSMEPPDLTGAGFDPLYIYVPPPPLTAEHSEAVTENIVRKREFGLKLAPRPPIISLDKDDPVLREQVRALSQTYDLEEGKKLLAYLIRNFNLFTCENVVVSKLVQGASGAKVFRFRPESAISEVEERVLKITARNKEWKLRSEVEMHLKAKDTLGNKYQRHVPDLEKVRSKDELSPQHIVSHDDWCAVCYDFLGGKLFGKFIDLETALVGSPERLEDLMQRTTFAFNSADCSGSMLVRRRVLETMLDWLYLNWYSKPNLWRRENRPLWNYQDGPDDKYIRLPPYQLSGKNKRYILDFLDSRQSTMGGRFFESDWENRHGRVREFIALPESHLSRLYSLGKKQFVILSPAHGDLNSNNILLWLDQVHPFLIDFPFFQESGHAIQDFARLEVEIKFGLMDRQEESPVDDLRALDHTHSQMPFWKTMEDHLLGKNWDTSINDKPQGCFQNNVDLCLSLVQLVRAKATKVQGQKENNEEIPAFLDEYRPALLFHTLRAIGYDSLPIFKRLLAVYSAATLLEQCRLN